MTLTEMSDQFDLYYNNITSNQAPGLNEYEKSVFLTRAQNEIVKNYFTPSSKGNNTGLGFDDSAKRQVDFSSLMETMYMESQSLSGGIEGDINYEITFNDSDASKSAKFSVTKLDPRSKVFAFPQKVFVVINESLHITNSGNTLPIQVIPLRYDEYTRLMQKPYKRPCKNQAWRLINTVDSAVSEDGVKFVEIITTPNYDKSTLKYCVRYIRRPFPIIVGSLDGLTIDGQSTASHCELDPILHEDILQRAVELAKVAWTSNGQDNLQAVMQAGQRSE